jgi:hypothetical protein
MLFQNEISREGNQVLPLSNCSILLVLKASKELLTFSSLLFLPFYLSFNKVHYKAFPTQDMAIPISLPLPYLM